MASRTARRNVIMEITPYCFSCVVSLIDYSSDEGHGHNGDDTVDTWLLDSPVDCLVDYDSNGRLSARSFLSPNAPVLRSVRCTDEGLDVCDANRIRLRIHSDCQRVLEWHD